MFEGGQDIQFIYSKIVISSQLCDESYAWFWELSCAKRLKSRRFVKHSIETVQFINKEQQRHQSCYMEGGNRVL